MARYHGPKSRKSRRLGVKLFPKDDKIFTKRNFPPGMHAQSRRRMSGYGTQLLEKQKAKWMYGVLEKQFRRYYEEAAKKRGETGNLMHQFLETRLDNVVYRSGFATTRPQARQLVLHGFFEVNGKKINIPSYRVKVGDIIAVKQNKQESKYIQIQRAVFAKQKPPEWLEFDPKNLKGKVLSLPQRSETDAGINFQLIIEHYSR